MTTIVYFLEYYISIKDLLGIIVSGLNIPDYSYYKGFLVPSYIVSNTCTFGHEEELKQIQNV